MCIKISFLCKYKYCEYAFFLLLQKIKYHTTNQPTTVPSLKIFFPINLVCVSYEYIVTIKKLMIDYVYRKKLERQSISKYFT